MDRIFVDISIISDNVPFFVSDFVDVLGSVVLDSSILNISLMG